MMFRTGKKEKKSGFTLIEIMVAVSIFVIVAFIVTATLLAVIDANRRANIWRSIMDSVNFATDNMSFKMKFGSNYFVANDWHRIDFLDRDSKHLAFCQGQQSTDPPRQAIYMCDFGTNSLAEDTTTNFCTPESSYCKPITSTDINVIDLDVRCSGAVPQCSGSGNQQVVILIKAEAMLKNEKTVLDFQTSVSQAQSKQ